jgi:hypothetical protein
MDFLLFLVALVLGSLMSPKTGSMVFFPLLTLRGARLRLRSLKVEK